MSGLFAFVFVAVALACLVAVEAARRYRHLFEQAERRSAACVLVDPSRVADLERRAAEADLLRRTVSDLQAVRDEHDDLKSRIIRGVVHPSHEWVRTGVSQQCRRCGFHRSSPVAYLPCDPSALDGKVEHCCRCGDGYPAADLIAGEIFCTKCRVPEAVDFHA